MIGRATPQLPTSASEGRNEPVRRVGVGLEVGREAVRAQLLARRGPDRGEPRRCERLRARGAEQVADGRGRGERDVVGRRDRRHRVGVERLGHRLVEREHVDLRAALAQRLDQDVAPLARARDQDALERHVRQRLDEPFGHRSPRDGVGRDPVLAERPRGAGAHRRDVQAGEAARVAAGGEQPREQLVDAVGARRHQPVVAAQVRELGRERDGADRGRLDHRRPELAQPRRERAGLRAGARDGDGAPVQRAPLEPRQVVAQGHHRPDQRHRGRPDALGRGALGHVGERGHERALARQRAALDHRDGLVRRAPLGLQPLGDPRQRADAHVEDERAREASERAPIEHRLGLVGVLVAGDEGDAAGQLPVRDRDARVRRRGDPGGHAGHDLELDARLAQHERLLAAAAEHQRIAALEPHHPPPGAPVLDEQPVDLLLRHLRPAALLADVDQLRVRPRVLERLGGMRRS